MIRATFSGFNTALTALQSNQKRLDVTGQNLANMHTTGYTRQALETSSLNYRGPISHYMNGSEIQVGFGVAMDRVTQIRDPFLDAQYRYQMEKSGYTDSLQTSFDSMSKFLDETTIGGIRDAFDDVRAVLLNLQDPSKVNDAVFESELRARMENLTNLLNESARKIEEARAQEFQRLDGEGTNQNGAEQTVNDILERIGKLNRQIKYNQVFNQPSLELMDERNVLLDELASYVPIEVTYYKEDGHKDDLDWPDDLRVNMLYVDDTGKQQTLTLIEGTEGAEGQNVGKLEFIDPATGGPASYPASEPYLNIQAKFTAAASAINSPADVTIYARDDQNGANRLGGKGGSIQAGLDALGGEETMNSTADIESANVNVRGYQYYMNHLDNLAKGFATIINDINNLSGSGDLLTGDANGINASTIGINKEWAEGTVHFGKGIQSEGNNPNDTALLMYGAMSWRYSATSPFRPDIAGITAIDLGNKSFADYMNNVSTVLATDSANNQNTLKTNVTVLNGIQDSRDALSGISLDEEAANMMTFMAAYNAASRLMTSMDEALNTLINNTGLVGR